MKNTESTPHNNLTVKMHSRTSRLVSENNTHGLRRSPRIVTQKRVLRYSEEILSTAHSFLNQKSVELRSLKRKKNKSNIKFDNNVFDDHRTTRHSRIEHANSSSFTEVINNLKALNESELSTVLRHTRSHLNCIATAHAQDITNVTVAGNLQFEDTIPATLPPRHTNAKPAAEGSSPIPSWCAHINVLPSKWQDDFHISNVFSWLRAIHIPHDHRANICMTPNSLRHAHHITYLRAAFNQCRKLSREDLEVCNKTLLDVQTTLTDLSWSIAEENDYISLEYFGEKRSMLQLMGYCILKGFLDDASLPKEVTRNLFHQNSETVYRESWYEDLLAYFNSTYTNEKDFMSPSFRRMWNFQINIASSKDAEDARKGCGRLLSTREAVTEILQQDNDTRLFVYRAYLDVRIATALAAIRKSRNGERVNDVLFTPKTGGRFLITSKNCERQQLHTDFPSLEESTVLDGTGNPGYFAITTGDEVVPIWIAEMSHRLVASTSISLLSAVSEASTVRMIQIPPFSILISRGDVFHAGAAAQDHGNSSFLLRYHIYFVPAHHDLPDAIHLLPRFAPKFVESSNANSDSHISESD